MDPVCYLLDEPSSGLDENTRNKLIEFLKNHVKTCLIVSHDREFLKKIVENIYLLKNRKIYSY